MTKPEYLLFIILHRHYSWLWITRRAVYIEKNITLRLDQTPGNLQILGFHNLDPCNKDKRPRSINDLTITEIKRKAIEKCFPTMVLFKCDHSNESYWAALSGGAVCYALQSDSNFWVCGRNPKVWPFKWKLLSSIFLWCCLLCCLCNVTLTFESLDDI